MVIFATRSEMPSFKVKIKFFQVTIKHSQALVPNKSIVLHREMLIGHAHSSQFIEWYNFDITLI